MIYWRGYNPKKKSYGGMAMFVDNIDDCYAYLGAVYYIDTDKVPDTVLVYAGSNFYKKLVYTAYEEYQDMLPYADNEISKEDLFKFSNPKNIIDSADVWDGQSLVTWMWDYVLEPNGITVVETEDGCIVFDDDLIKRMPPEVYNLWYENMSLEETGWFPS